MASFILLVTIILLFFVWISFFENNLNSEFRHSIILTYISFSAIAFILTEGLSLINQINFELFFISYLVVDFVLILVLIIKRDKLIERIKLFKHQFLKIENKILSFLVLVLIMVLTFIALYFPPHIWDSLTYHLPRIEQWIQNGNINHYPTNDMRQLFYQPFSEYLQLQARILSGNDYFNSSVQLFGYFVSLLGVSLIIKELNGNRFTQLLGALLVGSTPLLLNQATTTQNDLLMASFFVVFIYYGLLLTKSYSLFNVIIAITALGLSMLTKASIYVFAAPFLVYFAINYFLKYKDKILQITTISIFIISFINAPYFYRNYNLTGKLFGVEKLSNKAKVEAFSIQNTFANFIRTNGMLMGTPIVGINKIIDKTVEKSLNLMGKELNDKEITMPNHQYKTIFNPNSFHYYLIILSLIFMLVKVKKGWFNNKFYWIVFLSVIGLFFHSFLFRWSVISSTRYYLPLFFTFLIPAPFLIEKLSAIFFKKNNVVLYFILFVIFIQIVFNGYKPYIDARTIVKERIKYLPKTITEVKQVNELDKYDKELFLSNYTLVERFTYPFYTRNEESKNYRSDALYKILNDNNIIIKKNNIFENSREENYFYNHPSFADDYIDLVKTVTLTNSTTIGLLLSNEDFEYLFRRLILNKMDVKFENIIINPLFRQLFNLQQNVYSPDIIITNYSQIANNQVLNLKNYQQFNYSRDLKLLISKSKL